MENRWWSEVENWGNLGMGDLVPGETQARPGGALSAVATQSKQGQQDLKVVPTPKARPGNKENYFQFGFEIDTSILNKYIYFLTFIHMYSLGFPSTEEKALIRK